MTYQRYVPMPREAAVRVPRGILGALPSGAEPVAQLPAVFEDVIFSERPPRGATHYVVRSSNGTVTLDYYDPTGRELGTQTHRRATATEEEGIVAPKYAPPGRPGTVVPPPPMRAPPPLFPNGAPRAFPVVPVIVGGIVLVAAIVAGVAVSAAARASRRRVRANRHRRRRRPRRR